MHMEATGNSDATLRRVVLGIFVLLAMAGTSSAYGQNDPGADSPLRKFEKNAQPAATPSQPPAPPPAEHDRQHEDHGNDLGQELASDLINATMDIAIEVGAATMKRVNSGADELVRRDNGDILIPFLRYDFSRQSISGAIFALDNRVEAGYGPLAMMFEKYAFYDRASTLTFYRQMLLYRASTSKDFELDLGAGQTVMYGTLRTPLGSFSIPVKLRVADAVTIEFIPTWSGTINDYETALHWGGKFASFKVGYRYLSSPDMNLKGPFAGLALYF